jgi:hypothetical protein
MPVLTKAKRRVATGIGSGALHADNKLIFAPTCLTFCLLLNALLHWPFRKALTQIWVRVYNSANRNNPSSRGWRNFG